MNCNMELQIIPKTSGKDSWELIDAVIEDIRLSGLRYEVGPLGTTVEGPLEKCLDLIARAQKICMDMGAERIASVIKIDYGPEGVSIDEKVGKYRK